jgi:pimeloyl-ACP methyl ester carboxylesterase
VIARSWPGLDDAEAVRRDPSGLDQLGIDEIATFYAELIASLDRKPILIGHSFGALITQVLLDDGFGAAGVSIDSAPVKGIYKLPWSTLKSSFPGLKNPANRHRAVALSPEQFHYAFTNTMTDDESRAAYERYAVPGPGRPLFQAALANFNPHAPSKIDFANDQRAPLLVIAGTSDHVSPPSINRTIARLQHRSKSITAYKEFAGRSHFILGQPGWEEVADFALDWALAPRELDERVP